MSGIVLDGLELQDIAGGYWFEVRSGGPDDLATHRGEDDVIPEASGRDPGAWISDTRDLTLFGVVFGTGSSPRESYRANMDALLAKMDPTGTISIVVHPPNFGLGTGDTATLAAVRPLRVTGPSAVGHEVRQMTLELVCIDSPPEWDVSGGS